VALPAPEERVLSVAELTRAIRDLLMGTFPGLWVKGEVSGYKGPHPNGHHYFTLKDPKACIECVMFRTEALRLGFALKNGAEVEVYGEVSVYEAKGRYELIARQMRLAGIGALLAKLEELKRQLAAEGLFDAARKQRLPRYPRTIGVVTSPVGAAVNDIFKVLRARWPGIRIVLAPVKVQGEGAAPEIAAAIARFDRWAGADLLIVGRGGGSTEDLWAFNEEVVVRAIAAARTPIISAVGHEIDTTLADHAADVRAATPSNAAEIAVRDRREVRRQVETLLAHARSRMRARIEHHRHRLANVQRHYRFKRVRELTDALRQRVDDFADRMADGLRGLLGEGRERLGRALARRGLNAALPRRIADSRAGLARLGRRLDDAARVRVAARRQHAAALADRLRALSPQHVLERGYAIVRGPDGAIVRASGALRTGNRVRLEFARGGADATVTNIRQEEDTDASGQE